jgi:hypothetical protein
MISSRLLLIAFLAIAVSTGCSTGSDAPTSTPAPAPTRTDPVTVCTNQLVYWAGAQLRGEDDGGDYQHHGLNGEQNDALQTIVAEAQARGPALPADQIERQARSACQRIVASPSWGSGF